MAFPSPPPGHQTCELGLVATQPPVISGMTPAVQAALAQFLTAIGAIPQAPAAAAGAPAPQVAAPVPQVQPAPPVPEVQPPPQPATPEGVMSLQDQKMLGIFLRLSPMVYHGTTGEDAMEFLTTCQEHLHSLGLVETRGADFIAHQLCGTARQW